jgi:16S rRNA (guanine527-N7)-methyltransferase
MDAGARIMNPGSPAAIAEAFHQASLDPLPNAAYEQLAKYLEILERWNTKFNLTGLRLPGEIVARHFVECAFAAQKLPVAIATLMDYGSGAGFPGMMIAICRPEISVTLAEAHTKKASFLHEVVRSLGLRAEIWSSRVEEIPETRRFDAVSMRAVEKMEHAIPVAMKYAEKYLALLTTLPLVNAYRDQFAGLEFREAVPLPNSEQTIFALAVPRGTRS